MYKNMAILDKICNFFTEKPEIHEDSKSIAHAYIGKFVKQNSENIGESIAVYEGRLIVKNSENIMSIPLGAVAADIDNIVVGDFDREESLTLGKKWFDRKDTLRFDEKGMLIK